MIFKFSQSLGDSACPYFAQGEWEGSRLKVPLAHYPEKWPPFLRGYPNDSGIGLLIQKCVCEHLGNQGVILDVGNAIIVEDRGDGFSKPNGKVYNQDEYCYLRHTVGIETDEKTPLGDPGGVRPETWNGRELIYGSKTGGLLYCSEKLVQIARDQRWPFCDFYVAQSEPPQTPFFNPVQAIEPTAKQWPPEGLADILS